VIEDEPGRRLPFRSAVLRIFLLSTRTILGFEYQLVRSTSQNHNRMHSSRW